MRKKVVFPAPLAPSKATASPGATSRDTPRSAAYVGDVNGCRKARHPLCVGGNHFSRPSTEIAGAVTKKLIAFLARENNPRLRANHS